MVSLRYELVGGGRVAFGPEEQIRFIFRLGRNKAIEIEKDQERRRELKELNGDNESHKERIPGDSLLMKMASKRGKNHSTSFDNFTTGGMNEEQKKELLENSLKDGKTAAMNKMALYGEEWAEEENLPESSENGSGMGADTVLGLKASNGGFGKEIAQANARQSKLRVAKKNSKY